MSTPPDPRKRDPSTATGSEALGAKVRRLRLERGLPQDRLAIEAHVDQSGLSKFERGQSSRLGPVPLGRIAQVLGLTLDELVAGTDYSKDKTGTDYSKDKTGP
jgi:transcriptional regulator with XRE-family HTH domain